jgi:hypothetical protein
MAEASAKERTLGILAQHVAAAVAEERERCAQLAEGFETGKAIAEAIRSADGYNELNTERSCRPNS